MLDAPSAAAVERAGIRSPPGTCAEAASNAMLQKFSRRGSRPGLTSRHRRRHATIRVMGPQRFRAVIAADPGGRAVIAVPFDPDETWGAKADHPVGGTIDGRQVRGRLSP